MDLKNKTQNKKCTFKAESKYKLKIKEIIREFRKKNLFYLEHSKFATYIDDEYLDTFETEIVNFSKKWIRLFDQNMSAEKEPGRETHGNTRGLHSMDCEMGSKDICTELLLNEKLARLGGKIHDLGHLCYAHDGEHIISGYLKKHGIGELHHATLARWIIETESIHEKVLEAISRKKGRELTKRELAEYNKYKLIITDIAASHNGEGLDTEVAANLDKTPDEIEQEYINSFIIPGSDRKIVSKTPEGAVVRFNDPIAYVFKDFRDGVIGGAVNVNDPEYEALFIKIGISKEKLDKWAGEPGKKDKIVREGTRLLRENLIENSRGLSGAKMDKKIAELMYQLRDLNYDKVVKPRTRKIIDVLGDRTEQLIEKYTQILLTTYGDTEGDIELTPYAKGMLKNITTKQPKKVNQMCADITKLGIEQSVTREIEEIINGQENGPKTNRRKRLEEDIAKLAKKGPINDDVKEGYIKRVLGEIYLTPQKSQEMLEKRMRIEHPNATEEEIKELAKQNQYLRFETYDEGLARFKVALYVGEASNSYILDVLQAEGLLTTGEKEGRYVSGGDASKASIATTQKNIKEEQEGMDLE